MIAQPDATQTTTPQPLSAAAQPPPPPSQPRTLQSRARGARNLDSHAAMCGPSAVLRQASSLLTSPDASAVRISCSSGERAGTWGVVGVVEGGGGWLGWLGGKGRGESKARGCRGAEPDRPSRGVELCGDCHVPISYPQHPKAQHQPNTSAPTLPLITGAPPLGQTPTRWPRPGAHTRAPSWGGRRTVPVVVGV